VGIEPGTASPIVVSGEALLQTETCAAFGILLGRRNRFHIDGTPEMPDVAPPAAWAWSSRPRRLNARPVGHFHAKRRRRRIEVFVCTLASRTHKRAGRMMRDFI
jgi:hypothetical protein